VFFLVLSAGLFVAVVVRWALHAAKQLFHYGGEDEKVDDVARGLSRTSTRPTSLLFLFLLLLLILLLLLLLRLHLLTSSTLSSSLSSSCPSSSVHMYQLQTKVSRAPISVECLF
jgi:hypothetical protein